MKRRDAIRALLTTVVASCGMLAGPVFAQARIRRVVFVTGSAEKTLADWMTGFREVVNWGQSRFSLDLNCCHFHANPRAVIGFQAEMLPTGFR